MLEEKIVTVIGKAVPLSITIQLRSDNSNVNEFAFTFMNSDLIRVEIENCLMEVSTVRCSYCTQWHS